jgi:hypothetical protein
MPEIMARGLGSGAAARGRWTILVKSPTLHFDDKRRRAAMSRKTATVLSLGDYRARQRTLYFTRGELNQLLGLYSLHVIRGVWRDYAIDHFPGLARFSVFCHTHDAPAYTILKTAASSGRPTEFVVQSGRQKLRVSRNLAEALDYFPTHLSLVASGPG